MLSVQVDKGALWIAFEDSQEKIRVRRIRLESDVIEYWEITPTAYQGAFVRLGLGSVGVLAGPLVTYSTRVFSLRSACW